MTASSTTFNLGERIQQDVRDFMRSLLALTAHTPRARKIRAGLFCFRK